MVRSLCLERLDRFFLLAHWLGPSRYCPPSDVGRTEEDSDKDGRLSEDGEEDGGTYLTDEVAEGASEMMMMIQATGAGGGSQRGKRWPNAPREHFVLKAAADKAARPSRRLLASVSAS
ncbi:hypothetical protein TYRP_018091 [Tyrophagus putrescentiae]|nr:hypothetical protein TYRP_018091 [Tyrophagus putrescentiae]